MKLFRFRRSLTIDRKFSEKLFPMKFVQTFSQRISFGFWCFTKIFWALAENFPKNYCSRILPKALSRTFIDLRVFQEISCNCSGCTFCWAVEPRGQDGALLMATHPALLSRNLIGWLSGRTAASCPMNSAAKQNWQRTLTKIVSKFSEKFGKL